MSYNGSGTFLINSAGQPVVANTVISATVFNALTSDLATGLSTAITKDGQTTITNNIPFGSNKITGLGSGTAAADAANLGQVQSTVAKLITVTGTDTITGSMSPQLTAYAAGQLFYFVANAANTGAVTLNIDSLGAKNITRDGSSALAAGDINSGEVVVVIYDGTRFQMINAANSFGNTTINGTLTVTGNAGFQANVSITSALSVGGVFAVTGAATFTANPTLSGGTANGVLYLNGSKVATSGSAVTYDGTTFALGSAWTTSPLRNTPPLLFTYSTNQIVNLASDGPNNITFSRSSDNASSASLALLKSRGTYASPTAVQTGDTLGDLTYQGYGGTNNRQLARIQAGVDVYTSDTDIAAHLRFLTSSAGTASAAEKMRLDGAGNLGLGVTPSAWSAGKAYETTAAGHALWALSNEISVTQNAYFNSGWKYGATAAAARYQQQSGEHKWHIAASGTAGNAITFTQAMTLDASGNLGIGITSPAERLQVVSGANTTQIRFGDNTNCNGYLGSRTSNLCTLHTDQILAFGTGNATFTERARITAGGYFKASNDGTYRSSTAAYHEFRTNTASNTTLQVDHNSTDPYGVGIGFTAAAPNNTTNTFLSCTDTGGTRATIRSNGGLANYQANNVDLSDARTKNSITPAASMWDKVAALEIVTYKYNDQTHDDVNLGVIAQQVETVEPVWVDPDGFGDTPEGEEPLKTVYTKDITFAAIKALQEAMARIEQLEAKVAVLENK